MIAANLSFLLFGTLFFYWQFENVIKGYLRNIPDMKHWTGRSFHSEIIEIPRKPREKQLRILNCAGPFDIELIGLF